MSKESRRRQRAATQAAASTRPAAPAPEARPTSTSPVGTPRVGRRERSAPAARRSFLERYRTPLLGAAIVAVVAVVGAGLFSAATQPAFACTNLFSPAPTASPAAGATGQLGYVQEDMGNPHVANGTAVTYTYCPPGSGRHYNASGAGPITPRVYGPDDTVIPQGWIHNLEHGGLVLLYRGDSEAATDAGQAALRDFFDGYPPSPVCGFQAGTSIGPVFARFDEMLWPMAALVWGRVMPMDALDTEAVLAFDQQWGERTNPEQFCERPSASPSSSPAPSGSAPAASGSPSPAPSPSASPS